MVGRTSLLRSKPDISLRAPLEIFFQWCSLLAGGRGVPGAAFPFRFIVIREPVGFVRIRAVFCPLWFLFSLLVPHFVSPVLALPEVMTPLLDGVDTRVLLPKVVLPMLISVLCSLMDASSTCFRNWTPMESCVATLKLSWRKPSVVVAMHQTTR